jgi:hypothetical protein
LVELAPDKITSVTTYNSQVPAPLPRFKERQDGAEKPQPLDEQRRASSKMGPGLIKDGAMLCGYQERKVDLANGIADILFFHCSMMLCHDDALSRRCSVTMMLCHDLWPKPTTTRTPFSSR